MELVLLMCLATLACSNAYNFTTKSVMMAKTSCGSLPAFNAEVKFGEDMTYYIQSSYVMQTKTIIEIKAESAMVRLIGSRGIAMLKASAHCPMEQEELTPKKMVYSRYWNYYWKRNCEPCKTNTRFLSTFFHGRCFVVYPYLQQIRTVHCSYNKCQSPCGCSNTKCLPTERNRVWFFAWCNAYVQGWRPGLNYYYLNLPQDCTCHEQVFYQGWFNGGFGANKAKKN